VKSRFFKRECEADPRKCRIIFEWPTICSQSASATSPELLFAAAGPSLRAKGTVPVLKRLGRSGSAPEVRGIDRLALKLQVVEQLAFMPIKMLDHLKEMATQGEWCAGSPGSSDLFIC
jgi:hypothetical protein